jgi:hypothetical protein
MSHLHATDEQYRRFKVLIEVMWETGIALATIAAISVGIVSLSAHLDAARNARMLGTNSTQAAVHMPSEGAGTASPAVQLD